MEENVTSLAASGLPVVAEALPPTLVKAPKDYFLGPVFAASPQKGQREVIIGDKKYLVGGFCPLPVKFDPPALDVRHARALFSLLSFRDKSDDGTRLIRFSFNEFCRRYARSNGGRYAREIARILGDLMYSFIRVTDLKTRVSHEYRILEHVDIERRPIRRKDSGLARSDQLEMWFNGCTLSPEFYGILSRIAELQHLNLDVFTSIRAPLAQAIYLYIPSRACHHTQENPFEITVSKLLDQVSFPIPHQKCRRYKLFCQHADENRSILQQLDGLETVRAVFRVRLTQTNDGTDWKLQAWVENSKRQRQLFTGNSKLINAWIASGRSRQLLAERLATAETLTDYEIDLLEKAEVRLEGNERFFVLAKAMLPPSRFIALLAEAKGDALEDRKAKKNPTARLIYYIMEAVRALPNPALN